MDTARAAFPMPVHVPCCSPPAPGRLESHRMIKIWSRDRPAFRHLQTVWPVRRIRSKPVDWSSNSPRLHRARLRFCRPVCQYLFGCENFATAAAPGPLPPTVRCRFTLFSSFLAVWIRARTAWYGPAAKAGIAAVMRRAATERNMRRRGGHAHGALFAAIHGDNVCLHSLEWKSAILLIKPTKPGSLLTARWTGPGNKTGYFPTTCYPGKSPYPKPDTEPTRSRTRQGLH
jgi:hypothetical protein